MIARPVAAVLGAALLGAHPLGAQFSAPPEPRPATVAEVAFANMVVGGLTAATRALVNRTDPWRAFGRGAFGGAVHFAGKYIAVEPGSGYAVMGQVIAGTGTSIVGNAGRGAPLLDEVTIPFASVRLRLSPGAAKKLRASVDLSETVLIASALMTPELDVNWDRSLTSGALVLNLRRGSLQHGDDRIGGIAVGPVVLVDPRESDQPAVARHELVHVHQHRFAAEAWARPVEGFLRAHLPGLRRIPGWIEIGALPFAVRAVENQLFGETGVDGVVEAEANRLMRR